MCQIAPGFVVVRAGWVTDPPLRLALQRAVEDQGLLDLGLAERLVLDHFVAHDVGRSDRTDLVRSWGRERNDRVMAEADDVTRRVGHVLEVEPFERVLHPAPHGVASTPGRRHLPEPVVGTRCSVVLLVELVFERDEVPARDVRIIVQSVVADRSAETGWVGEGVELTTDSEDNVSRALGASGTAVADQLQPTHEVTQVPLGRGLDLLHTELGELVGIAAGFLTVPHQPEVDGKGHRFLLREGFATMFYSKIKPDCQSLAILAQSAKLEHIK